MITMSATKLWALVMVSGLVAACSCVGAEDAGRKTGGDEEHAYKNHRTSKNDTAQVRHKYPVYPAQVYANLSNARDFTTARTEQPAARATTTEAPPADVVRVFITPSPGAATSSAAATNNNNNNNKWTKTDGARPAQQAAASVAPSVYFVTSKSVKATDGPTPSPPQQQQQQHKTPVYSSSPQTGGAFSAGNKDTVVTVADEAKRKLKFNGTKIRRVLKTQQHLKQADPQQQQQPTVLLSATSTVAPQQQSLQPFVGGAFVAQSRNVTAAAAAAAAAPAYPVTGKVANSSGPSKPFATVLVPKQMLEGNGLQVPTQQDYSSSFRPIAAPVYASYRPAAVDTNAVAQENRRTSVEAKAQTGGANKAQTSANKAQTGANKAQTGTTKAQTGATKAQQTAGSGAPKLNKYGFVKQPTYMVEEFVPSDDRAAVVYDKRFNGDAGYKGDRSDQMVFVSAERRESVSEKPAVRTQQQLEPAAAAQRYDQQPKAPEPTIKYGFSVPESYGQGHVQRQSFKPADVQPFREYYPATEVAPAKEAVAVAGSYPMYDAAGRFEMRPGVAVEMVAGPPFVMMNSRPPTFEVINNRPPFEQANGRPSYDQANGVPSFEQANGRPSFEQTNGRPSFEQTNGRLSFEQANGRPSFEQVNGRQSSKPPKEFSGGPSTSGNVGTESSVPEVTLGDVNPKDVLKSLLLDMLKGKQLQSESTKTPKLSTVDETIDSFFKVKRPNIDYNVDNYDIETDMSCNLRSTKYITDGQCVTTKPVVEAVCADRCLVYASSTSSFGVRQRSSPTVNQQVEALHCVDGDSKLVRVQLHCRDGNTLNNVIKVVTNCRCKLHQIQPQMRSNSQSLQHEIGMPNPDIMSVVGGTF